LSAKTSRSRSGAPLSGQCVITREIALAEGVFAPGHLGELTQLVPFEMVDAALVGCGAVQRRLRKLPARVVVYLLLAAALFEECGYPAVWAKLTAALDCLPLPKITATALWHALARLGVRPTGGCPRSAPLDAYRQYAPHRWGDATVRTQPCMASRCNGQLLDFRQQVVRCAGPG
jgi:hypothetical protein